MTDIFGTIIPQYVFGDAAIMQLQKWMPNYLKEVALQWDRPVLPVPRSWNKRPSGEKWPEDQMPAVVSVEAGMDGPPRRDGDGSYTARYRLGIVIFCHGIDAAAGRRNAMDYGAAISALLLQKSAIHNNATVIALDAAMPTEGPTDGSRSIWAFTCEFIVEVYDILNDMRGPVYPELADDPAVPDPNLPGSLWPQVETPTITVSQKEG